MKANIGKYPGEDLEGKVLSEVSGGTRAVAGVLRVLTIVVTVVVLLMLLITVVVDAFALPLGAEVLEQLHSFKLSPSLMLVLLGVVMRSRRGRKKRTGRSRW